MLAVGAAVIVTLAVVLTAEQPPVAAIVQLTVQVPAVLILGFIAPVLAMMLKPAVEEYVPPVVPVCVTDCALVIVLQNGDSAQLILALGAVVIVTLAVVLTAEQPPDAAIVYVTVQVPAVLVLGVIAPVLALILKPVVEEYVPPVVPVWLIDCELERVLQNGDPAQLILALGAAMIVTLAVVLTAEHPPVAAIVYVTVQVPTVLALGVTAPVLELILKPAGLELYVPLAVPTRVTDCALVIVLQNGDPAQLMLALGAAVIVTVVVFITAAQPPEAAIVQLTVQVPAVLVLGVIAPVLGSMLKPVVEE